MRFGLLRGACVVSLLLAMPLAAVAIPPDRIDHYKIVPRASVLQRTGGFAGVNDLFRLTGEYDFLQEWQGGTPTDPLLLTARFDNAEIWGAQITPPGTYIPAIVLDVDELLNLESMRGELLPLGAPFDVYRFRGFLQDTDATSPLENSSIELFTALIGPWMFLYGETTPPRGSADFFEYKIKALARRGPWADMNEDGVVDAADYTVARDHDPAMLYDWALQYGESEPDTEALEAMMVAAMSNSTAVPEPGAMGLAALACLAVWRRRG